MKNLLSERLMIAAAAIFVTLALTLPPQAQDVLPLGATSGNATSTANEIPPPPGVIAEYTLRVTSEDIAAIGAGLGMLPFAKVKDLVTKMQTQINTQEAKAAQDAKAAIDKAAKPKK